MSTVENPNEFHDKLIDLELAKKDNKSSKIRKYLPAVVLTAGLYYSFYWSLGLAIGYIGSKIFSKYLCDTGRVGCVFVDCGKWKLHFHHWIWAALLLIVAGVLDYFYLPRFFVGIICGIIAHDVYDFNDWHKILVKNEEE